MKAPALAQAVGLYVAERRSRGTHDPGFIERVLNRLHERVTARLAQHWKAVSLPEAVPSDLTREDLLALTDEITQGRLTSTATKTATLLKLFGRWLNLRGYVLVDPARTLVVPKVPRRLPRVPSAAELARLLAQAEPNRVLERAGLSSPPQRARRRRRVTHEKKRRRELAEALRDAALLELLYGSGLRLSEALNLDLPDIDLNERTAFVRSGKGGKDRVVPLTRKAVEALIRYLGQDGRDALFSSKAGSSAALLLSTIGGRLPDQTWRERRLLPLLCAARLPKDFMPHRLRHACAVHLLESGADVVFIARLLGHERLQTTAIYLQLTTTHLRSALKAHPRERG